MKDGGGPEQVVETSVSVHKNRGKGGMTSDTGVEEERRGGERRGGERRGGERREKRRRGEEEREEEERGGERRGVRPPWEKRKSDLTLAAFAC